MNKNDLKKIIKERTDLIEKLNKILDDNVLYSQNILEKELLREFLDRLEFDEKGIIINNSHNRRLLVSIDELFVNFNKKSSPLIINTIVNGLSKIMDFNSNYYSVISSNVDLAPINKEVINFVQYWLGVKNKKLISNGYLDTLIKNETSKNLVKDTSMKIVFSQKGWRQAKKEISKIISGDNDNLGAFQKYYRNYTYDLYSQIDRATSKIYQKKLNLQFAIYAGDIIKTSREFCKERVNKVFHISEILEFNPPKAKPPDYNPITDLGGYGCRHHLNWISDTLAISLRPDSKSFLEN